jgi:hypothetical protein
MMYEIKLNIGDLTGKTLVAVVTGKDKVILQLAEEVKKEISPVVESSKGMNRK